MLQKRNSGNTFIASKQFRDSQAQTIPLGKAPTNLKFENAVTVFQKRFPSQSGLPTAGSGVSRSGRPVAFGRRRRGSPGAAPTSGRPPGERVTHLEPTVGVSAHTGCWFSETRSSLAFGTLVLGKGNLAHCFSVEFPAV